jgi:cation:H+ antiporter
MSSWGAPALLAVFLAAAAATWIAGLFLSKTTDILDDRFNLGDAVGGLLLLGLAGSLPELAITASAALSGDLGLAVGNLLGGIAMQTLVLVLLDATSRKKRPLTSLADLSPLFEAVLVITVLLVALMGAFLPASTSIGSVSPASLAIVVLFLLGVLGINKARKAPAWQLAEGDLPAPKEAPNRFRRSTTVLVLLWFGLASIITLVAGVMLEQTGNELADDWGINGAVFGATILAAVTALPEISSGIAAVRLGDVGLAMSDIYGGNAVQLTFFLLADILAGSPVLPTASHQSLWLGAVGAVMTGVFAYGLLLRPQRKLWVIGLDSAIVLATYVAAVLFLPAIPG